MRNAEKSDLLGLAVDRWRSAPRGDGRLGVRARQAVLQAAVRPGAPERRLPELFFPLHRWASVAALPLLLLSVMALTWRGEVVPDPSGGPATMQVSKQGDHVVILIANGKRQHRVTKSESPRQFDPARAVKVRNGKFVDRISEGSEITFYRID